MIRNLVFKGGGVLGIAYAGAVEVLEEKQILKQVTRVAGTSSGAITAALLSLKYSASELYKVVQSTDFKLFQDGFDPLSLASKYGIYKGNTFLAWMKQLIAAKGIDGNATFSDFEKAGLFDLHVFAADLNIRDMKEFSVTKTPNVIVAQAIRASMSIPLFFDAWTFPNGIPDNHVYVDGGTIFNYPITCFDTDGTTNSETLGFYLADVNFAQPDSTLKFDQMFQYIRDLFQTLTDSQLIDFKNNPEEEKRSVIIDDFGISSTNFSLSDGQKLQLFNSGKTATANYLAKLGN
ncbi:MAG: patatin-like phospholipase family protein [Bacteroidia bacterium]